MRGRVRAESKAKCNGAPAATLTVVVLIPAETDAPCDQSISERVYDEALKYLDIA